MVMGSGQSSESIWTAFDTTTTANVRHPVFNVKIAWTRIKDDSITFATVGSSVVGGSDIIQGQLKVITEPDKFKYYDESVYVLQIQYDRKLLEPLGSIAYALGEVILNNTNLRFTSNISNTIGTALKPQRPLKIFTGFKINSIDKTLPTLYGLTDQPREDKSNRRVSIKVFDYLSYINDYELESSMYIDQRSDEIIEDILTTIGFTSTQFSLDTGLNTIGFAWFKKGERAGESIRKICEAEEANFYQDEEGLLRFENRRNYLSRSTVGWTINSEDIISWEEDRNVKIINRCIVKGKPRSVGALTEICRISESLELQNNETKLQWMDFESPTSTITDPVSGVDYTANTVSDGSGTDRTDDVTITVDKFVQSAKLTIVNNWGGVVYITLLKLRGTPATITNEVEQIYEDEDSKENYGRYQLIINNNYIDSNDFAYYLARAIVRKYSTNTKRIRITVPAIPQLQLKDKIQVKDIDTDSYINYRVMRIKGSFSLTGHTQTLTLREVTGLETDTPAIIGVATIDNIDEVVWT